MYLFDVNIWVNAHREDAPDHKKIINFVSEIINSNKSFAYSPLVLSGFLRIVTHPGIFTEPTDFNTAHEFVRIVTELTGAVELLPEPSHWHIFTHLCTAVRATGNLIPDAWFAALAISSGCTWITSDRDYMKFPGLKYKLI
jgi:uncharacterized protein